MRSDMYKVIVERPRSRKRPEKNADRRRKDFDGAQFLGMRAGYGRPALNENLNPLKRYLHAQIGRPWSKVYAEISANIDRRNAVQHHVLEHLDRMIAIQVEWRDGKLIDLKDRNRYNNRFDPTLHQPLYVDPRSGLIRPNQSWRSRAAFRKARKAAKAQEEAGRKRVIDDRTLLLKLDGEWFEVRVGPMPPVEAGRVFDAVLKRKVSTVPNAFNEEMRYYYGRRGVYAVSKRQLSRREIESYELPRQPTARHCLGATQRGG